VFIENFYMYLSNTLQNVKILQGVLLSKYM